MLNFDPWFWVGDEALEVVVISVGDNGALMLITGSGDPEYLGSLGSKITVFCLRGEVNVWMASGRVGLGWLSDPVVGDLAGLRAGTGGIDVVGIFSRRFCSI